MMGQKSVVLTNLCLEIQFSLQKKVFKSKVVQIRIHVLFEDDSYHSYLQPVGPVVKGAESPNMQIFLEV